MLVDGFPDRTLTIKGKEHLYFGGTSYLGMATNSAFQKELIQSLQQWGTSYGSSRNANIQLSIYKKFEAYFSKLTKTTSALTVSSGTLAGKLVVESLLEKDTYFFHYPKTHPAILAPNSLPLFIDNELHPIIKNSKVKEIVITADAILSGEVEATNFNFLDTISKEIYITLVIDESHSLGVIGKNGRGISPSIKNLNVHRKIIVSSLGKALGLVGGIIASDTDFIKKIKESTTFISSSGVSPAYLSTFLRAQKIYTRQRQNLEKNLDYISKNLEKKSKYIFNCNYPVIYIDDDGIFEELLKNYVIITCFKYPTYKKPMNRVVITANHTIEDLKKLITILNTI